VRWRINLSAEILTLVAVKASRGLIELFKEASKLIERELGKGMIVDFIDLSQADDQFSDYFSEIEPFYKREESRGKLLNFVNGIMDNCKKRKE
jgi:hypothetical protein